MHCNIFTKLSNTFWAYFYFKWVWHFIPFCNIKNECIYVTNLLIEIWHSSLRMKINFFLKVFISAKFTKRQNYVVKSKMETLNWTFLGPTGEFWVLSFLTNFWIFGFWAFLLLEILWEIVLWNWKYLCRMNNYCLC